MALNLFGAVEDAKRTKAKDDIANMGTALDLYKLEKGRYPSELRELTQPTKKNPDGLLKKLPKDPWDNDYIYEKRDRTYLLKSLGADEVYDYHEGDVFSHLADNSVDFVYDNYGAKGAAAGAMRVLRPGGWLVYLAGKDGGRPAGGWHVLYRVCT